MASRALLLAVILLLHSDALLASLPLDGFEEPSDLGSVVELTDATIGAAVSRHDHILVDFYAPWCKHCQSLSPELDEAAPLLADGIPPIMVAKINVDKYKSVAAEYDISFFPTLKFFANGYPTDYDGPHSALALVTHVRRLTAPAIEEYPSESQLRDFLKTHKSEMPIFVGFGLEASTLEKLAHKYRNKAWFCVLGEYSEKAQVDFQFDERHAVAVLRDEGEVQEVFYGPFEGPEVANFVKRNLLPLVAPLNSDSLKFLTRDGRPNVVAFLESYSSAESDAFLKKMKLAAQDNRDFVFSSVVTSEWPKFVRPFALGKQPVLPTVIIWNKEFYAKSKEADAFVGDNLETSLTGLLQGYREHTVKLQRVKGPTLYERAMENTTQLFQVVALVCALFFQWFRKNREQGQVLREEEAGAARAEPGEDGLSAHQEATGSAAESSAADPHKED